MGDTLNHPSLVDEREETRVLVTAHRREGGRERSIHYNLDVILACIR